MKIRFPVVAGTLLFALIVPPVRAQSILPAADRVGTIATPQGNQINITGGQLSSDGKNLFHSFTQFGVDQNQIANFLSNPTIQNILGRVNGGEASVINGLLQVTGGNSNLFLMNPAGIVFGQNASLNVPASFTAITANRIGFGSGNWFDNASGDGFAALNGHPTSFEFATLQPSAIVNAANLAVTQGDLSLFGGTVLSPGTLSAPNGTVTIAAVPGQNLVRLTQVGSPLSLEFVPGNDLLTPSIAQLLTGGNVINATGVNVSRDGTVQLSGSGIRVESGDVVANGITAKNATLSATNNIKLVESQISTTENLNLFASNTVLIRDSVANPFLARVGGNLYIQGNQGIDILALNHLNQTPFVSGGKLSLVSNGIISGDAHFRSGNGFSVLNLQGGAGKFVSYYDPIISAIGDVVLGDYTGASLKIEATGSIAIAAVNITSPDTNLIAFCAINACSPDAEILARQPALILRAGVPILTESAFGYPNPLILTTPISSPTGGSLVVTGETITSFSSGNLWVELSAQGDVSTRSLTTQGGPVKITSQTGSILVSGAINTRYPSEFIAGGDIELTAPQQITVGSLIAGGNPESRGGTITVTTPSEFLIDPSLVIPFIFSAIEAGGANTIINANNIRIASGNINTGGGNFNASANDFVNSGGDVNLADGDFTLNITSPSTFTWDSFMLSGGRVSITTANQLRITNTILAGELFLNAQSIDASGATLSSEGLVGGRAVFNAASDITLGQVIIGSLLGEGGAPLEINTPGNVTFTNQLTSYGADVLIGETTRPNSVTLNSGVVTNGGSIQIQSRGAIAAQTLSTFDELDNNVGDIILEGGNIVVQTLNASGSTLAGKIDVRSQSDIQIQDLIFGAFAQSSGGAPIQLDAPGTIQITGDVTSNGAGFLIGDRSPFAEFIAPSLTEFVTNQQPVSLVSRGDLTVSQNISTNGGDVNLGSQGDLFVSGLLTTSGGSITLSSSSGAVEATSLNTSGSQGGNVTVMALDRILTGAINASGSVFDGGNVFLDPIGDIQVGFINAQGGRSGIGGTIDITAGRFFRATDTFLAQDGTQASLSTIGGRGSGSITIRQGGGLLNQPFVVGTSDPLNGTAGAITTGVANQILEGSFPSNYTQGTPPSEINLVTESEAIVPPEPEIDEPEQGESDPEFDVDLEADDLEFEVDIDLEAGDSEFDIFDDVEALDDDFADEFREYFGTGQGQPDLTIEDAQDVAATIEKATGVRPAFIYVNFVSSTAPQQSKGSILRSEKQDSDVLELIAITAKGKPIRKVVYDATRSNVTTLMQQFLSDVTDRTEDNYLPSSQALYKSLIASIEPELQARGVNNLVFLMESGLRSLPLAALHDGKQFLIEKYSVGLMPSLSLTDTRYTPIKNSKLLAMGASKFQELEPLPAVPDELAAITRKWGKGRSLLNEQFTIDNVITKREQEAYGILHLATHSEFKPGTPSESYIQFWDKKLTLNQIRNLRLSNPPLELMVLSACRTAIGDEQAELGFAGLAAQSGVKSALASLWYVSDDGTLALMSEFYRRLANTNVNIKADALRQAQLAMAKGEISIVDGKLKLPNLPEAISLSTELTMLEGTDLSHPYYWAGFTLIGNPW